MNIPKAGVLLPLVKQLKVCPAQDSTCTHEVLVETWNAFKQKAPQYGDPITPAMMAGLVLYDEETFALLLNEAEHAQLAALGQVALERFQQRTNPPNKLGKTLAATLKGTP